jgi:hypothetical protein
MGGRRGSGRSERARRAARHHRPVHTLTLQASSLISPTWQSFSQAHIPCRLRLVSVVVQVVGGGRELAPHDRRSRSGTTGGTTHHGGESGCAQRPTTAAARAVGAHVAARLAWRPAMAAAAGGRASPISDGADEGTCRIRQVEPPGLDLL